ncbi:MAG: DNA starvation/stationary phase protection protein [Planctomycetales bacterium]|nr:DNA starvation/stationary phase protection protein [Planctomycetales bacterium]
MAHLKRHILKGEDQSAAVECLQACLFDLVDLALQGKQAHWNVVGPNFRSIHLQLDEIILTARNSADEIAERIVTLAKPADGRTSMVGERSRLPAYPQGLKDVPETVSLVADRLEKTIEGLRAGIDSLDDVDLVSQDLLIGASSALEKHMWMVQAQEG